MPGPNAPRTPPLSPDADARLRDLWRPDPNALGGPPRQGVEVSLPALEQTIVMLGNATSPFGRTLLTEERRIVEQVFERSLDASRIRVVEARIANAPTTLGNQIRVEPGKSFLSDYGRGTLVHEAAHVWQYQTRGTRYISCSLYHQLRAMAETGSRNAAYDYELTPQSRLEDFGAEQQASIIEHFYLAKYRHPEPRMGEAAWLRAIRQKMEIYERLMRDVRARRPRTQQELYNESLMQPPHHPNAPVPEDPSRRITPLVPLLRIDF